jgi:flagellar biosynthesis protein FlhG
MVSLPGAETLYGVLGVAPSASPDELERAYRYCRDLYGEECVATYSLLDAEEMKGAREQVEEAWQVLGDPQRRHAYDVSHGFAASDTPLPVSMPPRMPPPAPLAPVPLAAAPPPAPVAAPPAPVAAPREEPAPVTAPATTTWPGAVRMEPVPPPPVAREGPAPALVAPVVLAEPVTGPALRRYREQVGVSLREISTRSKVGVRYLEYIEQDRHRDLPAPVYLRGFLQEYARVVGLDPKRTAEAYLAQLARID